VIEAGIVTEPLEDVPLDTEAEAGLPEIEYTTPWLSV